MDSADHGRALGEAAHIRLRLPVYLKDWVSQEAGKHGASLNSEIVRALVERRDRVAAERARLLSLDRSERAANHDR